MKLIEAIKERDEILYKGKFIQVRKKDGWYEYVHDNTGMFVAVLAFSQKDNETLFLGRFEEVPPHEDGISLVSLTGGLEEGENPKDGAVREFMEESGISITKDDLIALGQVRPSKGSDSVGYLYAVDLGETLEKGKIFKGVGDGTLGEEIAYCKVVKESDIPTSKDTILISLYTRFKTIYS